MPPPEHTAHPDDDPYLWLEEVDGERARAWVRGQNGIAEGELEADPGFPALRTRLQGILDSTDKIPYPGCHAGLLYNFWRDAVHVRGIWRRTTLEEYRKAAPSWETLIDLDRLAQEEGENWVWGGASFLEPEGDRCMVSLSRGGGDARVLREFDLAQRGFVEGGFALLEAKSDVAWIDRDTLFVGTDFGPGSMTDSGYPRLVKRWRRGQPLADAQTVYEAQGSDLSASGWRDATPGFERDFLLRQIGFYSSELFVLQGGAPVKLPKPEDANAFAVRSQVVIELRSDWDAGGRRYPQGALLAADFDAFLAGGCEFQLLFEPTPTTSLDGLTVTRDALLLTLLDNVANRLVELRFVDGMWQARDVGLPASRAIETWAFDAVTSNQYFLTVNGFLEPATLYLMEAGSDTRAALKSLPAFFEADGLVVRQFTAASKDGTRVPYFAVMKGRAASGEAAPGGAAPTVLYGYGGFEVALKPSYGAIGGAAWLERGGVYVMANIRGGGEFGPRWHQAALQGERQRAFDDFIAVAEDLVARGITTPQRLGIMGGSNGGLLVGAVMVQRPELFGAVVCQVPLLDMRRYHTLLAGASWMGEYGDPDDPAQWEAIGRYSPYQNVGPRTGGSRWPRVLFTTSTRDDRVHPGHARKMAARMLEYGHDVLYWENTEGGHAGAADNGQIARMWALTWTFLRRQLT